MNRAPLFHQTSIRLLIAFASITALAGTTTAAEITQNVSSSHGISWNDAIWANAAPTSGNTYVVQTNSISSASTDLGSSISGRVRAYAVSGSGANGGIFEGDSIRVVSGTELLLKESGDYSANVILDGGVLRFAPDNGGGIGSIGGTINVISHSVAGVNQSSALTINSTIIGSASLRLAGGKAEGTAKTITFSEISDFSGYTGLLDIGGGASEVIVNFGSGTHNLSGATLALDSTGAFSTSDRLNLDGSVSVHSFLFESTSLASGIYSSADLNTLFTTSRFTGLGSLIVAIPEPASFVMLAGLGALGFAGRRRRRV